MQSTPWVWVLLVVCLAGCSGGGPWAPRFAGAWTERSLCDAPPLSLTIVDDRGEPLPEAEVWTEALLHEGGTGFGEILSHDVKQRGRIARSDARGHVAVCDVTAPLVKEYGTNGWQQDSHLGSSWRSLVASVIFVEVDGRFVRVQRFASARFGSGILFAPPSTVAFVSSRPVGAGERPAVGRPTGLPLLLQ